MSAKTFDYLALVGVGLSFIGIVVGAFAVWDARRQSKSDMERITRELRSIIFALEQQGWLQLGRGKGNSITDDEGRILGIGLPAVGERGSRTIIMSAQTVSPTWRKVLRWVAVATVVAACIAALGVLIWTAAQI